MPGGTVSDTRTVDTCDAEYGISAFDTGPVKVTGDYGKGFEDSAIYIGTITDTLGGTLLVQHNTTVGNSRGIIIEDSPADTAAVDITVRSNVMNRNTIAGSEGPSDGLFLHNSQGVLVTDNTAKGNVGAGYHADVNSHDNVFKDNTASGNGDGPFVDDSTGNCGKGNSFPVPAHCS